ncbi:MAG: hypothetical protein M2R45_01008 [Verrucomicrobia subdivision 3 bacterium]|nr:hypothetical protein [Limisphaerales bacterium]MCS1414119.1 hypothetical protein [Limisphaerales bacterium]
MLTIVRSLFSVQIVFLLSLNTASFENIAPHDWPNWRGLTHNGIAAANQSPHSLERDQKHHLEILHPGRGHASLTIVGDFVHLPTADETNETQSVLCLNRHNGKIIWSILTHADQFYQ